MESGSQRIHGNCACATTEPRGRWAIETSATVLAGIIRRRWSSRGAALFLPQNPDIVVRDRWPIRALPRGFFCSLNPRLAPWRQM